MSRKADPAVLGGFILGALALGVGGVVAIGGGAIGGRDVDYAVIYFEDPVAGLAVGSPVTLRGVRIGEVDSVRLEVETETVVARSPVYIALDRSLITFVGHHSGPGSRLEDAVAAGLRARLQRLSFVTGQTGVALEMLPATSARFVGADRSVPEIPSVRAKLDSLVDELGDLPLPELAAETLGLVRDARALIGGPEAKAAIAEAATAARHVSAVAETAAVAMAPAARELTEALRAARAAAEEAKAAFAAARRLADGAEADVDATLARATRLVDGADRRMADLTAAALDALATLNQALRQADAAARGVAALTAAGAQPRLNLDQLLSNLALASRALRGFAEQVERNPNALLLGRR